MSQPLALYQDRTMLVPKGAVVRTGYVPIFRVRLACRDRMGVGDVATAYQKRLQLGDAQPWPPPVGRWEGDGFVIHDGRHEWVAAVMLGLDHILVAWVEGDAEAQQGEKEG